jgi:serine/threonine protein kinase/Tol biopolymer transport system component
LNDDRRRRIEDLCHEALEQDAAVRASFVATACGNDHALRSEVEALLAHAETADGFLSTPLGALAAGALTDQGGASLVGRSLGTYQIHTRIGSGAMGDVYRARDSELGRDVAIKVLPTAFTSDHERLARFEREARVLASLNHPNIGAIYGVETADSLRGIVLELVEGETLADRLGRGPIPIKEAVEVARQIADALDAAHEKGIIHRDLKPANVKVTPGGLVKVLDFGLAKIATGEALADLKAAPTITIGGTHPGLIVGTAAYMSPEQARGQPVDKRTDIWAFGCVLYQMLTGRSPFDAEDLSATLARVIEREPDWTRLPKETPSSARRVLRRCLTKELRQRMHDIADARIELEGLGGDSSESVGAEDLRKTWTQPWWLALSVLVTGSLLGVAVDRSLHSTGNSSITPIPSRVLRTSIDLPPDAPLALSSDIPSVGYDSPVVAVSPDGGWLAYVANTRSGRILYVRDLASGGGRPLPGTDGATHPFFSPDGQWIGFLTSDHIKKVSRQGGAVISLCEATTPVLAWWVQPNAIYFTEYEYRDLSRVSADGGKPEQVVSQASSFLGLINDVLPDGQTVLATTSGSISRDFGEISRVNLHTRQRKLLIRSGYAARYVSAGFLLFARAGNLMAIRYDIARGDVVGEPVTLASGAAVHSGPAILHAASSANGLAVYAPGGDLLVGKLAWVDRSGTVEYLDVPERMYGVLDLTADGDRLAVHVADVKDYIWIWDLRRSEGRRVANSVPEGWPLWSPDGRKLAGTTSGGLLLHPVEPSGAIGEGAPLQQELASRGSWSPDGNVLAATVSSDLFRVKFVGVGKLLNVPGFDGQYPTFSADGHWLAYNSAQTGTQEVFIRSYPEGKVAGQVSTGGGVEPRWKPSGELFYRKGHLWFSTHVSTTPELRWDPPRQVFDTEFIDTPGMSYDVSRDGRRLLVVKRARPVFPSKINLIVNWFDELKQRAATN